MSTQVGIRASTPCLGGRPLHSAPVHPRLGTFGARWAPIDGNRTATRGSACSVKPLRARSISSIQSSKNGSSSAAPTGTPSEFDYDLVIIGAGVGGHGAALHAVAKGLKVAILEGHDVGGTCVNRGCVPSKALLAAAGQVRSLREAHHLRQLGLSVQGVEFDREGIAGHAKKLASTIQSNLRRSLEALGVDILVGQGRFAGAHTLKYGLPGRVDVGGTITARDIIIATGSVPFVPPGIGIDGKTVFTSDHALRLEWLPPWLAIIGSGYIGLEFSDVYTALGSEVTFIEALPELMAGFDREIAKVAQRQLIQQRPIDFRTGVIASKVTPGVPGVKPVTIELTDFATKKVVEELEVDACLVATGRAPYTNGLNLAAVGAATDRRGFVPVDERMRVLDSASEAKHVPHVYCIGDANGKYMLAHAASAQGISAVENILRCRAEEASKSGGAAGTALPPPHVLNHRTIPAACFTHPEVAFVGLSEEAARREAEAGGWLPALAIAKTYFKGNTKALAEDESDGLGKLLYRRDTGEILGCHLYGLHAADLIHEFSNAMAQGQTVQDLYYNVHAHPTVAEVVEELIRHAKVDGVAGESASNIAPSGVKPKKKKDEPAAAKPTAALA